MKKFTQPGKCANCKKLWAVIAGRNEYRMGVEDGRAQSGVLSEEDWNEIYYALETKLGMIKNGYYASGRKGDNQTWMSHLRSIIHKIGPDGRHMFPTKGLTHE